MSKEPAVIVGAVITAIIGLWRAFGGSLTTEQEEAILTFVAVAAPLVTGIIIRSQVYAPATVERLLGRKPTV